MDERCAAVADPTAADAHASRRGKLVLVGSSLLLLLGLPGSCGAFRALVSPSSRSSHGVPVAFRRICAPPRAARPAPLRKVPYGLLATVDQSAEFSTTAPSSTSFIDTELRGAAMRLHTKSQAPREGQAPEPQPQPAEPYVTTLEDYLQFLVDSQAVFQTFEDVVKENDSLSLFRDTGLERTEALEADIAWVCDRYGLERPAVGGPGIEYSRHIREVASASVPKFACHWYNFYFAHTAGGRMIGKQMSNLLLGGATLEFYQWRDGDLAELKARTKRKIDDLAASWTPEQRRECVGATPGAFEGGAAVNSHLMGGGGGGGGGKSGH